MLIVFGVGRRSDIYAQVSVDSLFAQVVERSASASITENLDALKDILKQHPDYAPAHHEMAKLYMVQNTPQSRLRAKRALERAIRLDRNNVAYQITIGDLLRAQGFRSKANAQFEKIYNTYPDNAKAAYEIGHHAVKQFYHYQDMGRAFIHSAQEDLERAIVHLKRSIELNPKFQEPYYLLGILYDDQKRFGELVKLSNRLLNHRPNDKDAWLFKGLGLQKQRVFSEANEAYQEALARMDIGERKIMESVDLVIDEDKQKLFKKTGENLTPAGWQDAPEHDAFWRERDPLFLTSFNERRMAHYGRLAYANLHFSQPSKGVEGWQTDMGETYIRFGAPMRKKTVRPQIIAPRSPGDYMTVYTHREHWFYEDFMLTFQNWDGVDGWHFSTVDIARSIYDKMGSDKPSPLMIPTTEKLATEVFQEIPSRYIDPYRFAKYSVPHQLVSFKEGDSVRVELSYVLPRHKLLASAKSGVVDLENGIFLFDNQWQSVYRNVEEVRLDLKKIQNRPDVDSLQQNHLISMQTLKVKPGDYRVVVEARSRNTGTIGTVRQPYQFAFSDKALSASGMLLASQIEPIIPFPEGREDLRIVPNPMRTFYRHDPVYIYLEIYNLERNEFGQTRYEITYQLESPNKKGIDPSLFVAVDLSQKQGAVEIEALERESVITLTDREESEDDNESPDDNQTRGPRRPEPISSGQVEPPPVQYQVKYVLPKSRLSEAFSKLAENGVDMRRSITAQYVGRKENDFIFLQIDVAQVPVGIHQLVLTIKDLQTQQSVQRETLFRVLK